MTGTNKAMMVLMTDSASADTSLERSLFSIAGIGFRSRQCTAEEGVVAQGAGCLACIAPKAPITRAVFDALPELKMVTSLGEAMHHIDLEAAKEHGVWVTNVPAKSTVTLRQLAVHGAGVKPWAPFYRTLRGKSAFVEAASQQALVAAPLSQYQYSDLGMILLMAAIEQVAQQPIDGFVRRYVYPKLGVHAVFVPAGHRIPAAPTEHDAWRGRVIRGEVHDENAFAMGGVSGHAGLFGTAEDVARIGNAFLGGGGGLWKASTVRSLTRRVGLIEGSTRAIVWDTFAAGGSGGSLLSSQAFGHTGFTGTSVWCDPAGDVCMVLLTNRVHPSRKNTQIRGVRRAFCDLVVRCLKRT